MRSVLLFLLSIFYLSGISQKISPPSWKEEFLTFTAAKIKSVDSKTKKIIFDDYKESTIDMTNISGSPVFITISIPDHFYLKLGTIHSSTYKKENDNTETISYTVVSEKKMANVVFYYQEYSDDPYSIIVTGSDNIEQKPMKMKSIILYELKR